MELSTLLVETEYKLNTEKEKRLEMEMELVRLRKDIKDRDGMLDEGEIMLERERREIRRLHEAHKTEVENRNIYYEEELARQHKNKLEHIDQLQEQHQRTEKHIHEDRDYELKELRDRLEAEVARLNTEVRPHVRPTLAPAPSTARAPPTNSHTTSPSTRRRSARRRTRTARRS